VLLRVTYQRMSEIHRDALVVGAGFAGIYQSYMLREQNIDFVCIDKASGVGGTWYWNRYPGAMSDTHTYLYRFSWDKEDLLQYPWKSHYIYQPEILEYLNHVVDRHDLRKHMRFDVEMQSAIWNEQTQRWVVKCHSGDTYVVRYLVNALGLLSTPKYPEIPGISDYRGQLIHTAAWPDVDLTAKTVGIIGNGSTGVQVMTAIAPKVKKLVSFQRHPQYSVPSGQGPVSTEYRKWVNDNYDDIYKRVWQSSTGFGVPEVSRPVVAASPEERREVFESLWRLGNGFRFMFSGFGDITTNLEANKEACSFIRSKIDEIVTDPRKAEILKPKDLYARRPLCDTGYYQIFNQDNVDLINLQETPITKIVEKGVMLSDGTVQELDALIFATGFDAVDGSYLRCHIQGRNGETLKEHWEKGATTYGAVACAGFPNMYIISGPQGAFANFPCVIESEVTFISSCIAHTEHASKSTEGKALAALEVQQQSERHWQELCTKLCEGSLFKTTASWIFGTNVPGREPVVKFFFGGLGRYRELMQQEVDAGFPSFSMTGKEGLVNGAVPEIQAASVVTSQA
jgi:cyclohexanone monooxygenase